jgi:hypothetical protein
MADDGLIGVRHPVFEIAIVELPVIQCVSGGRRRGQHNAVGRSACWSRRGRPRSPVLCQGTAIGKGAGQLAGQGKIHETAMGDPTLPATLIAAIFWAKCQMGWRAAGPVEPETEVPGNGSANGQVVIIRSQDGR